MKKKFKCILALGCLALACIGAACASETKIEEYEKKGYKIFVTYDANGGKFIKREGITVVDGFNPDHYEQDINGQIHISLLEPTDISRPTNSSDKVTLTKTEHFFAGWYQTRTVVRNENGEVIDDEGVVLEETEDGYVYPDKEGKPAATPAYEYSDYWDFEEDTVDYTVIFQYIS